MNIREVMVLNNKLSNMCNQIFDHYGSCEDCDSKVCCTAYASAINNHEIDAIARYLHTSSKNLKRHVVKVHNRWGNVPIASQKLKEPCIFLKDGRCSVYPVRPRICRIFPFEVGVDIGLVRLEGIEICPIATVIGDEICDYYKKVQHLFPDLDRQKEYDNKIVGDVAKTTMDAMNEAYTKANIGWVESQQIMTSPLHLVGFYMARVLQKRDFEADLQTFAENGWKLVEYILSM